MLRASLIAALAAAATVAPAAAQDASGESVFHRLLPVGHETLNPTLAADRWETCDAGCTEAACCPPPACRLRFSVPGWLPEVHGSATVRGVESSVNVTTRKLFEGIDDLNFIFSGRVEADAGRWGLLAEGLYVNLAGNREFVGGRIDSSAGFENAIVDTALTYDIFEPADADGMSAELLAGARYWLIGGDVSVTGPRGNSIRASGTRQWVDPIIGGRIAAPLTDDLLMRLRADVGGFGAASDFTWNVEAVGEYKCSDCCGIQLGYRVLDVDYSRGDGFAYDVNYRGPVANIIFEF